MKSNPYLVALGAGGGMFLLIGFIAYFVGTNPSSSNRGSLLAEGGENVAWVVSGLLVPGGFLLIVAWLVAGAVTWRPTP